jgi:hypothetical protein
MAVQMEASICDLLESYGYQEWKESPFASPTNRVYRRSESGHEAHVRVPASKGDSWQTAIYYCGRAIIGKGFGIEVHSLRTALKRVHPEFIPGSDRIRFRGDGTWRWQTRPAAHRYL